MRLTRHRPDRSLLAGQGQAEAVDHPSVAEAVGRPLGSVEVEGRPLHWGVAVGRHPSEARRLAVPVGYPWVEPYRTWAPEWQRTESRWDP
jgi:hypothetical protein